MSLEKINVHHSLFCYDKITLDYYFLGRISGHFDFIKSSNKDEFDVYILLHRLEKS